MLKLSSLVGFTVSAQGSPDSGGVNGVQRKGCTFSGSGSAGNPGSVYLQAYGGSSSVAIIKSVKDLAESSMPAGNGLPAGSFVTVASGFKNVVVVDDKPFSVAVTTPGSSSRADIDAAIKVAKGVIPAR